VILSVAGFVAIAIDFDVMRNDMNKFVAIACLVVASMVGCKKEEAAPSHTVEISPPRSTPEVPNTLTTTRESASGRAATTTPPASEPSH
jgi:hypothetical protein